MSRTRWGCRRSQRPRQVVVRLAVGTVVTLAIAAGTLAAACGTDKKAVTVPPLTSTPSATATTPTPTPSATAGLIGASSFESNGDLVSGWYWLRDSEYQQAAMWTFDSLPASGDLVLRLAALATDSDNGSRGVSAHFYLSYGQAGSGSEGPLFFGRLDLTLANVSPPEDALGYTCQGTVTIPRAELRGAQSLAIRIGRDDPSGELASIDTNLAFNSGSVAIASGGGTGTGTQVSTAPFWSNGDLISGWYWLRDAAYQDAATWVVRDIPSGLTGLVIEFQVLATNTVSGGRGFDARFYLSWGALEGDTVTFGRPQLVTLPNTSEPDDPVGYTCTGWTSIALPALGADRTLVVQIRRNDESGAQPPLTRHIAVMAHSVAPLFGE